MGEPEEPVYAADHVGAADRGEHVEGVLGAGQLGVGHGLVGDLAQGLDEPLRLVDLDQAVVPAVDDEEGRCVLTDAQQG